MSTDFDVPIIQAAPDPTVRARVPENLLAWFEELVDMPDAGGGKHSMKRVERIAELVLRNGLTTDAKLWSTVQIDERAPAGIIGLAPVESLELQYFQGVIDGTMMALGIVGDRDVQQAIGVEITRAVEIVKPQLRAVASKTIIAAKAMPKMRPPLVRP